MSLTYKWFLISQGVKMLCTLGNLELRKFTLLPPGSQLVKEWEEQELKKKIDQCGKKNFSENARALKERKL